MEGRNPFIFIGGGVKKKISDEPQKYMYSKKVILKKAFIVFLK